MEPTPAPPPAPTDRGWRRGLIAAMGVLVAGAFVVGILVLTRSDDDTTSMPTVPPETTIAGTTVPTTAPPSTTAPGTTEPTASTTTTTTTTTTTLAPPSGASWTVTSGYFDGPMTLDRVVDGDGIVVYDGQVGGEPAVRCVVVVITGREGWREVCGEPDVAQQFVTVADGRVWIAEVGADPGAIVVTEREPAWALRTNGCAAPIADLVAPIGLDAQVATGVVCAGDAAFVRFGAVLLQEGGPDGGGVLLVEQGGSWTVADAGTSVPCRTDAGDRCAQFRVTDDLFEAMLPIPPEEANPPDDQATGLADATATAREAIGAGDDVGAIVAAVEELIVDPTGEATSETSISPGLEYGRLDLVVVVADQLDDSIGTVTMAVWIAADATGPDAVVRATSWNTCARGIDGDLCV